MLTKVLSAYATYYAGGYPFDVAHWAGLARAEEPLKRGVRGVLVALCAMSVLLTAAAGASAAGTSNGASDLSPGDLKTGQGADSTKAWPSPAPSPDSYKLDTGDYLHVRFYDRYDREDLNGDYVIGESGQIRLPRIGAFDARGKTTVDLEHDIRGSVENRGEKLGNFFVEVIRCRPFYVAGVVNRPGPYPFVPGLTVMHAVALAGGLYRVTESAAVTMREKREFTDTMSRLAEAMARRARLEAELNGSQTIVLPKELDQLEPLRVREIIASERAVLDRSRQALNAEKSALEKLVALKQREAESIERDITRLARRIDEQMNIFTQFQKLHQDRVINQQRFIEAVIALDSLQRDKQAAIAALSHANIELEKAGSDITKLTLAANARIAQEIAATDFEITRQKRAAEQLRDFDAFAGGGDAGPIVTYKIVRRNANGQTGVTQASETAPLMPGDVIEVGFALKRGSFF